ncbi:hypothetical protein FS837_009558 [Tulasnella sp. UAMH 9824]|nr:hypothetical protein FS837_009558 [Tulasnella sp. UAMH 9824]
MSERNARSVSRGREFASAGRGGAGNMVRSESQSRAQVTRTEDGDERGRDVAPRDENRITHAGRGGQGNVRSPSRDPAKDAAERAFEDEVLRKNRDSRESWGVSYGRGGTGNIEKSRSRSREPGTSSGRGGLGNIIDHVLHPGRDLEKLDEEERAAAEGKPQAVYSHGRGGVGNLGPTAADLPHGTRVSTDATNHTGRGGQGNITV